MRELVLDLVATGADVLTDPTDLVRHSTDASPYRLVPQVVVRPHDSAQVARVLRAAARHGRHVTFRAAGTSLNGQSQSDDVLVDLREHFTDLEVLDAGHRLRCEPGVVLGRANAHLARHGRVLGPDPASAGAATVGGVLANNASGMTCGVRFNATRTIESLVAVLPSGTIIDTGAADADAHLASKEPQLHAELLAIRDGIRADRDLTERIRAKFSIKNTSGLRLDAFCDHDSPAEILTHLLVGSEGILAAVTDTTWRTIDAGPLRSTAFLRFPDAPTAAALVAPLNDMDAQAVELMDAASLKSLRGRPGVPAWITELPDDATDAVLLTERRTSDPAELDRFEASVADLVADLAVPPGGPWCTRDRDEAAVHWRLRSGMLASIGAARPAKTTLITEDVVVPPTRLPEAIGALQQLLVTHGFTGAVNGHASAGNLHFYLYLDASTPAQVEAYRAFMDDLVALVVDRFDGSLKGEHGVGRNMAPWVEREWGPVATQWMWRVKRAFDPDGLLAPGVFLSDDPEIAFRDLKTIPTVHPTLDPCIECGFCEPVCPSRHLTTTPRQRIAVLRQIARGGPDADLLTTDFGYAGVDTCAGDSSCAIACPVDIDTGAVMKQHRQARQGRVAEAVGRTLAQHWSRAEQGARLALTGAALARPLIGDRGLRALTRLGRRLGGDDLVPRWVDETPRAAASLPRTARARAEAVHLTACINRIFGPSTQTPDAAGVTAALVALAERAGHPVWIPDDIAGTCCATVWQSKGLSEGNELMAARAFDRMWVWSDAGRLPLVVDASSCTLGFAHDLVAHLDADRRALHARLRIVDALTWVREVVLPDLTVPRARLAVVHPTCSMHTLGIADDLGAVARASADEVFTPVVATCCGFAGDRGMLHPELTGTATAEEASEVRAKVAALRASDPGAEVLFLSGNRTCELGLEHATGEPYEHAVIALERLTR